MKEVEFWINEVNIKEKERTMVKKSFEKKVNIPCYLNNENTKFISQKRFYSIKKSKSVSMDKKFLDSIDRVLADDNKDLVFFSYKLKNFIFYQMTGIFSAFENKIMEGIQLMIINNKFIIIISEERRCYYYQADLLIKRKIELDEEFRDIYDFLILNLQFLSENNLKDRKKVKYKMINKNNINKNFFKFFFINKFNLGFFETMAKYKYENVVLNHESFLIIFKNVGVTDFSSSQIVINKIIFLDGFFILVYNNYVFFLDYSEDFDEFLRLTEVFVSLLVPYFLYKNDVYLNAYISEK